VASSSNSSHLPPVTDEKSRKSNDLAGLAALAAAGDVSATSRLLEQLRPRMSRLVRALLGSLHTEAEDVLQQAMIAVTQALPAFRADSSVWHYASRIVARTALASARRAAAERSRQGEIVELDSLPSLASGANEELAAQRRRSAVQGLLATLPEEQAETLALRVVLGFTLGEVAEATGAPVNTVRSRIRLAKEALKERIQADAALVELLEVPS
jgi:RNA polymerase sigma factor (sigma-70 family)